MTYNLRAGAPFDEDNIFNIPATDAGPLINLDAPYLIVVNLDAGTFASPISVNIDGGYIPLLGTATYDPSKTYGPDDIVTN
jgi:hypothetical protein